MPMYANIDGAKKEQILYYTNINGAQHEIKEMYSNINGVQKKIFSKYYRWYKYTYKRTSSYTTYEPHDADSTIYVRHDKFTSSPSNYMGSRIVVMSDSAFLSGTVEFSYTGQEIYESEFTIYYPGKAERYTGDQRATINNYWVIVKNNGQYHDFIDDVSFSDLDSGNARAVRITSMQNGKYQMNCDYNQSLQKITYYRYDCISEIVMSTNPNAYESSSLSWVGSSHDSTSPTYVYGNTNVYYKAIT